METKQCPYCGGEIMKAAKKCKHCGEWLVENIQSNSIRSTKDAPKTINTITDDSNVKITPQDHKLHDTIFFGILLLLPIIIGIIILIDYFN